MYRDKVLFIRTDQKTKEALETLCESMHITKGEWLEEKVNESCEKYQKKLEAELALERYHVALLNERGF